MPLVLTSNEVYAGRDYGWKDIVGSRYHYPNRYRNMIQPGVQFIYYRGVRRSSGQRGQQEYFGCGIVGTVWRDPDDPPDLPRRNWHWYCAIENYIPFITPVPAKMGNSSLENLLANEWGNGVRNISQQKFGEIVSLAGIPAQIFSDPPIPASPTFPPLSEVNIQEVASGLLVPPAPSDQGANATASNGSGGDRTRRSRFSKLIGDRAEAIALKHIEDNFADFTELKHVSALGQTPGWDIQYLNPNGRLNAVEVKGTSAEAFTGIALTRNELRASLQLGSNYWIYLVADCLSANPRLHRIEDPRHMIGIGTLAAEPLSWELTMN